VHDAVASILKSKTFDNGVICASEQSIVAHKSVYEKVKQELLHGRAYLLKGAEVSKVGNIILTEKGINAAIVGQTAHAIAALAGIQVPTDTSVLVSEEKVCDETNPFAHEKLSPILALYEADSFEKALQIALKLVLLGGAGHTSVLHVDEKDQRKIDLFATTMPTGRLLINSPASQGAIGLCNKALSPSLMLGCGSWGGNSQSGNIAIEHLLNHKIVAENRESA
jgi:acetaldehyde dehydrogenase/alcohol dehydrogenase